MDSTTWLNLVRGNRLSNIMGLQMSDGVPYRFSKDYTFVEIPLAQLYNPSTEEVVDKATRNQRIRIIPACTTNLRSAGYKILVKVNPRIHDFGTCTELRLIDTNEEQPVFHVQFHKDMDAKELDWAVRLHLIG